MLHAGDPKQTFLQQQAYPFQQPHQQAFQVSTFTNTTPHHPQQVSLAPMSLHTTGGLPLHPPSFFQTSLQSQTPSVDSPQSQSPKTGCFPQQTPPQVLNPLSPHPSSLPPSHPSEHNPQPVSVPQPATATLPTTPACTTLTGLAKMSATPAHAKVLSPVAMSATPAHAKVLSPETLPTTPAHTTLVSLATMPVAPAHTTLTSLATSPTTPAHASPVTLQTTPAHASPVTLRTTPARVLQSRGGGTQQQSNMALPPGEYKQILNLYCQKKHINLPSYSYEFPEDSVGYIASVTVEGKTFTSPPQGSKKVAESIAAAEAVKEMGIKPEQSSAAGSDGEWCQVPLASHTGMLQGMQFKDLALIKQRWQELMQVSLAPTSVHTTQS